MEIEGKSYFILDANVLIDITQCDKMILPLISKYSAQVVDSTTILDEVKDFSANDCLELRFRDVELIKKLLFVIASEVFDFRCDR